MDTLSGSHFSHAISHDITLVTLWQCRISLVWSLGIEDCDIVLSRPDPEPDSPAQIEQELPACLWIFPPKWLKAKCQVGPKYPSSDESFTDPSLPDTIHDPIFCGGCDVLHFALEIVRHQSHGRIDIMLTTRNKTIENLMPVKVRKLQLPEPAIPLHRTQIVNIVIWFMPIYYKVKHGPDSKLFCSSRAESV